MIKYVLSQPNKSGSDLISTSHLSLLARFYHIVTATPVNLCVYNTVLRVCVSLRVCLSGYVCFVLSMF